MTLAECMQRFVGHTVKSHRVTIESMTGRPLTEEWLQAFFERRNVRLQESITAVEGVHEAVAHLHDQCQGRIAVASGADRFKVEMMLNKWACIIFLKDGFSAVMKCRAASLTLTCTWPPPRICMLTRRAAL
jgi:beta-phosphoglucomutase-like phosphatase (HAD superfamily)